MQRASGGACLSEIELTRLLEGQTHHGQRDRWLTHVELCPRCRLVLAESSRHLAQVDELARLAHGDSWTRRLGVAIAAFAALVVAWLLRG